MPFERYPLGCIFKSEPQSIFLLICLRSLCLILKLDDEDTVQVLHSGGMERSFFPRIKKNGTDKDNRQGDDLRGTIVLIPSMRL